MTRIRGAQAQQLRDERGDELVADAQLIDRWLARCSVNTVRAYRRDVDRFLNGRTLRRIRTEDLESFTGELESVSLAPTSIARKVSAARSLLSFAYSSGYLPFDVGGKYSAPLSVSCRSKRELSEEEVRRMVTLEPGQRNRILLQTLYVAGLLVSELCVLTWSDVRKDWNGVQLRVIGRGGKIRYVALPESLSNHLLAIRSATGLGEPVFRSREGGRLSRIQVLRIVKAAAERAGIEDPVSPQSLRDAHAVHAIQHGAPIESVAATLGHGSVHTTQRYIGDRPTAPSGSYLQLGGEVSRTESREGKRP